MALPKVTINILNGSLGGVNPINDGEAGFVISSPTLPTLNVEYPIIYGEPITVTSLKEIETRGITSEYDVENSVNVYRHFKDFFDTAGVRGPVLHIIFVPQTITLSQMLDISNNYATKLLDYASGIKLLAVVVNPDITYIPTITSGIDQDCYDALILGQSLAEKYQSIPQPIQIIIEGRNFTGNPTDLIDLKQNNQNHCSIFIGGNKVDGSSSVGLVLGKLASIPVQRKISRIQDGSLTITEAYYSNSLKVEEQSQSYQTQIHDKGFITLRTIPRLSGYYFSDDPTATTNSDDYSTIARSRVIKKMIILAYDTFVRDLNNEVLTDQGGTLPLTVASDIEAKIERAIRQSMVVSGELVEVEAIVDPKQNVVSTGEVKIQLYGKPHGYLQNITVNLGFKL